MDSDTSSSLPLPKGHPRCSTIRPLLLSSPSSFTLHQSSRPCHNSNDSCHHRRHSLIKRHRLRLINSCRRHNRNRPKKKTKNPPPKAPKAKTAAPQASSWQVMPQPMFMMSPAQVPNAPKQPAAPNQFVPPLPVFYPQPHYYPVMHPVPPQPQTPKPTTTTTTTTTTTPEPEHETEHKKGNPAQPNPSCNYWFVDHGVYKWFPCPMMVMPTHAPVTAKPTTAPTNAPLPQIVNECDYWYIQNGVYKWCACPTLPPLPTTQAPGLFDFLFLPQTTLPPINILPVVRPRPVKVDITYNEIERTR